MADILGIDRRKDKNNPIYKDLMMGIIPSDIVEEAHFESIFGGYRHEYNYECDRIFGTCRPSGNIGNDEGSQFSQERYKFLLNAPFEISNKCCNVMKKKPATDFYKSTGKVPITAQMAAESRLRTQKWLQHGCNAFDSKKPISNPMSFWTEQDVLLYIKQRDLPICSVYKEIKTDDEEEGQLNFANMGMMGLFDLGNVCLHTTGCERTGCIFCGFGIHLEKTSRYLLIDEVSNPALRDFCMRGGHFDTDGLWKPDGRGLGYFFVLKWINLAGGFNMYIPEYERYEREYGNERTRLELQKAVEIHDRDIQRR